MRHITPAELSAWLSDAGRRKPVLLDVREPWEVRTCAIPGSLHMPMAEVAGRAGEIDSESDVVVICHHGARSLRVAHFLEKNGCTNVHNLTGGVDAWARTIDPAMPVY